MTSTNPYTLTFGKKPTQLIRRLAQVQTVVDAFTSDPAPQQAFVATGVRGSGKTVFMTEVTRVLASREEWITVELNPGKNLIEALVAKLSSKRDLVRIFETSRINLSFLGFGVEIKGEPPIRDLETALHDLLAALAKRGKRVLVTIDEVTPTPQMREFASAFQILVRADLPLFLLMTGLYENMSELQNEKDLTFLYRAPKIEMGPLNIGAVARDYEATLNLTSDKALSLAKASLGYAFAFQVLGYFSWEHREAPSLAVDLSRQYLEEYAYDKIWDELSSKDRELAVAIARCPSGSVAEIKETLGITQNQLNPYRSRLIKKGIIDGSERGSVSFRLPFFADYVKTRAPVD